MKRLIIIFLVLSSYCSGQSVASFTFQPVDMGIGARYDYLFKDFGVYGAITKGNYKVSTDFYIKDHYKFAVGILVPTEYGFITGGVSYNRYGKMKGEIRQIALNPVSVDFGGGVFIGRFVCSIRMDFVKWEPTIDIGFVL